MRNLTERQEEIYAFLIEYIEERGFPPSIRDITKRFGFKSPKAAADHLAALERKGFIKRERELSRAIEIPARTAAAARERERNTVDLPLVGRIAAGSPILAVENVDEVLTLDSSLVHGDGTFLLRVVGDSMIDAHIQEGDFIVVKPQESAIAGEIVVALVGDEATVKRFFPEEDRVRLQPENPRHAPIIVDPASEEFRIVGRVVGLVRKMP
ncbi:MAG: transcriptional repressor LexA [bacterium]